MQYWIVKIPDLLWITYFEMKPILRDHNDYGIILNFTKPKALSTIKKKSDENSDTSEKTMDTSETPTTSYNSLYSSYNSLASSSYEVTPFVRPTIRNLPVPSGPTIMKRRESTLNVTPKVSKKLKGVNWRD
jgi:hypothetical protein